MDGEVGALAGAVDGEETEGDAMKAEEVGVVGAELFAGELGGGVRGDGLAEAEGLGERDGFEHAVDGGTGGKNEARGAGAFSGLQEVEGAEDVGVDIEFWVANGGAHAGSGCEVDDGVGLKLGEDPVREGGVADVGLEEFDMGLVGREVGPFQSGCVEIVEVVDDTHGVSGKESFVHDMGPDEPGSAGDKQLHPDRLSAGKKEPQGRRKSGG